MKKSIPAVLLASAALVVGFTAPTASAADPAPGGGKMVAVEGAKSLSVDMDTVSKSAKMKNTKTILESNPQMAAASANVCGSGYTISTGASRYGIYGTTYTWTNGTETGDSYYDKPICAVFFNDTGYTRYMGIRLKDNYTATPDVEDFGAYRSYAGPVYQKKGYCGRAYSYMEVGGKAVVDNYLGVGSCN
ncbi:hypothetical protein [Streptomyces halobius]|uniref:Peptidase inhibitor family I36 n=1 Tax=Streptomyces halobius TaxID=2879846 RepID=A0ABY4MK49_9ACTN|nr:hypothetical protein [Streptomyces halobius]UQA96706.1 hypothetical protein K9S39_36880 [Streptomyces halobius]